MLMIDDSRDVDGLTGTIDGTIGEERAVQIAVLLMDFTGIEIDFACLVVGALDAGPCVVVAVAAWDDDLAFGVACKELLVVARIVLYYNGSIGHRTSCLDVTDKSKRFLRGQFEEEEAKRGDLDVIDGYALRCTSNEDVMTCRQ